MTHSPCYRLQAVAYAKKYGLSVLRWVNPVRNCDDKVYRVETIESLLPGAVQYFVLGAPANIIQNHNPVATGIVNGTRVLMHSLVWPDGYAWKPPAHSYPGQVHDVPRPAYAVVVPDVNESEKQKTSQNMCSDNVLIPLQLEPAEDTIQGVHVRYMKFPLDLGFATTFHKVQGQTMRRVIMFLHERKTKQLAKLQWESLYVAITRVKRGDDMRVCFRGCETKRSSLCGLQHLKKLRRPALYDAWQSAYDKKGNWDDKNLKAEAALAQRRIKKILERVSCLSRTSVPKLKQWCSVLDVDVKCKPGTTYKNKPQYLDALRPVWLACRTGRHMSVHDNLRKRKSSVKPRRDQKKRKNSADSSQKRHKKSVNCRRRAVIPAELAVAPAGVRQLRAFITVANSRMSPAAMDKQIYATVGAKKITFKQFYALAVKGQFTDDDILVLMLQRMCPNAYVPSYLCDSRNFYAGFFDEGRVSPEVFADKKTMAKSWVRRIESGKVLMLPYNWPVGVHWVAVFVWKDGNEYHVQSRNSCPSYFQYDKDTLKHSMSLVSKIYVLSGVNAAPMWTCSAIVKSPVVTHQNTNECAFHVVANGFLAEQDKCFSHTFDNTFVDQIRSSHIVFISECRSSSFGRNVIST